MKPLLRLLGLLYFLYAATLFIVGLLVVFIVALPLATLGALRGGNLIYRVLKVWANMWFALIGIRHKNLGDLPKGDEAYVFVANHISWLDAALVPKIFQQPIRPLGKAEIGKLPIFGFIYRRAVVMVDRSSTFARKRSVDRLKAVLRKGVSILVFPEGTFNETGEPLAPFFDGAFRIAIETGTPIKPILLLDTYTRMPYYKSCSLNPGKSRAVFLGTISVAGRNIDDVPRLREEVRALMAAKLESFNADWIGRK
jgi:1-acyl-sn-glycerol-3-phosphate acyltransferase